jgi:Leucine-rich repeat (LRR) protein
MLEPALEAALRSRFGMSANSTFTTSQHGSLTELDLSGWGIESLEGLEMAANLTLLNLQGNNVSDLSPLAGLTNIRTLVVANSSNYPGKENQVEDLSPLVGLSQLTGLYLRGNLVTDLSPLLTLWWNSGSRILDVSENGLDESYVSTDSAAVQQLQSRGVGVTWSSQRSPWNWVLEPALEAALRSRFGMSANSTFTTSQHGSLTELDLSGWGIESLEGLEMATNLTVLNLQGNNVSDLSPLVGLSQLTGLYLRGNRVTDLGPLLSLWRNSGSRSLDVSENGLDETNGSTDFAAVQQLQSRGVSVTWSSQRSPWNWMLEPALEAALRSRFGMSANATFTTSQHDSLTLLDLSGWGIERLEGLEMAANLTALNLQGNNVSDLSPLVGLTQLENINLRGNRVTDLSPLVNFWQNSSGCYLDVSENGLDERLGSPDALAVQQLQSRGVSVTWWGQRLLAQPEILSQTIGSFAPIGQKTYGDAPLSVVEPTASSGLPVTISVKSGPATISGNTMTLTGVGTVVLAANQAGNANYNAAPEVTTSFTVGKGNQTISAFAAIEPKLLGALPFVISAPSASSALPVVLTIKRGPATISTNRTVTLKGPGSVTIAANQAGNANFNRAPEVTTTFLVTRPLSTLTITVPTATEGTVTLGFAGATTREIGANYTVTAIPASGMVSKGWRKGNATLSANATLKFTMEANMQLMPLFAPDFSKLAGTYNGLVGDGEIGTGAAQDMQAFPLKNGFVTFSLGSMGTLSGNLSIDGQTSPFTGNFTTNRTASITIVRANKTPAEASLQLTSTLPGEISGNITVSGFTLSFRALRAAYVTPALLGGNTAVPGSALSSWALRAAYTIRKASHPLGSRAYTLVIPAPSGIALGHGFATISIQSSGFATITGRLATGDPISASAGFVDAGDGNWVMPIYSTRNGIFTGEIVIPKIPSINSAELLGSFEWLHPENANSSLFPAGFLGRTNVAGSRYSLIAGNSLLSGNRTAAGFTLNIDPQRVVLSTPIAQNGTWPLNNTPAFLQPISSGIRMTFSSAKGSLQGVFNRTIHEAQVPTQFQGAMFGKPVSTGNGQPMLWGAGYFISGNKSVPVEITLQ